MSTPVFICLFCTIVFRCNIYASATGFVEEVSCGSRSMIVVLNKSDPDIVRWRRDPAARPVVYVYGHKERTPCGLFLKSPDNSSFFINFTIPYGPVCSVHLTDLEPNHQTAETSVAIEDHAYFGHSKPVRIHHVFCIYTKRVEAIRMNDVSTAHEVVASTGGKPKPKVQLLFRDPSGKPLRAARFGDPVGLYLMLDPDNAYKAINPKHCVFSDRDRMEEPNAKTLTFIQSDCPVQELSEIVEPVKDIQEEIYFTRFQAFRFGDKPTVFAHCTVEVCLEQESCAKACFAKVKNTSMTPELLRSRLRRNSPSMKSRRRRSTSSPERKEQVAVSNFLTVLDEVQSSEVIADQSIMCSNGKLYYLLLAGGGFFASTLFFLLIIIGILISKLKKKNKAPFGRVPFPLLSGVSSGFDNYAHGAPSPSWTDPSSCKSTTPISWNRAPEISIPRVQTIIH